MSRSSRSWASLSAGCASVLLFGSSALAQTSQVTTTTTAEPVITTPPPAQTIVVQPPPAQAPVAVTTTGAPVASGPVARETRESGYVPNLYLLTTGLILWGGSYTASVIVAASSSNSADQHLYVPIVGPWIDLGNRGGCPVGASSCDSETASKVGLVADGVLQALGTIQVVWGFLKPEHREVTTVQATRYTPAITFEPSPVASGYGLAAFAKF
jgi:hypothetical protein